MKENYNLYHQKPLTGIKGRIQTRNVELEEIPKHNTIELVAEKVTFLSSNNQKKAD